MIAILGPSSISSFSKTESTKSFCLFSERRFDLDSLLALNLNNVGKLTPYEGEQVKLLSKIEAYKSSDNAAPTIEPTAEAGPSGTTTHESLSGTVPQAASSSLETAVDAQGASQKHPSLSRVARPAKRKISVFHNEHVVEELDLLAILSSSSNGKAILACYRAGQKEYDETGDEPPALTKLHRKLIADEIHAALIKELVEPIQHQLFEGVALKVREVFPTERKEKWYDAPHSVTNDTNHPKGKIPDKFRNVKNRVKNLERAGSSKQSKSRSQPRQYTGTLQSILKKPITDLERSAETWLQKSRSPWPVVLEKWRVTLPLRLRDLFNGEDHFVNSYLEQWPVLKHASGFELVLQDFKDIYPEADNLMFIKWDHFLKRTLSIARKDVKDSNIRRLLVQDSSNDRDVQACIVLFALPGISANRSMQVDKKTEKLTIDRARDSFIVYCQSASTISNLIEARRELLKGRDGGGQPLIVLVGKSETAVTAVYVSVADLLWKCDGVLEAVDLFFKSFFALHIEYPPESSHILIILQKAVYGLSTEYDKNYNIDYGWLSVYES
ncbi:hypothetical protein FOCC_FOCC016898 [Frankliniella occidentalis]|uniref:Uncharacterized protein LOC113215461 n=1 Tax=Frankliniella occidentalis TaxID=133901 RepID=A0A9C6X9P0_FRAOC|nr:uncharacterized protein LOC113215461 [Frankliniella occidentalis]KAE8737637.1 hypothetical protein FOCC_FOCC016898 [Frankliniella occidentalis]